MKYQRVRPAASVLGRAVAASAASLVHDFEDEEVLLVPVPLHRARFRERGFNQAELIACAARSGVAEALGRKIKLETAALIRRRATEAQFGLTLEQRMAQVKGAFRVMFPERVKGREVLLVDDVLTTGATVSECARVLMRAGASRVCVATAARAMKHANDSASELIRQTMEGGTTVGVTPVGSGASRAASNAL
ncbi:MAG TPA: phosphoribosyltransferase family protein [Candidatus Acidoferrales bacterium]|nr:phosphoribosyltransferase family protein [Candidatus Acidoferrales bacterium]